MAKTRRARRLLAEPLRALARRTAKRTGRRLALVAGFLDPPVDLSDHYTDHLHYAIAGMLNRGNLYCFDYALRRLPSESPILEVGSFCGLSTNVLTYYKKRLGLRQRLITCDDWRFERAMVGELPVDREAYAAFVKESYRRGIERFSSWDLPYSVHATSDDFFVAWREGRMVRDLFDREIRLGGPISFAYVDANHDYEYVERDFRNLDAWLEPGGFVLFDDSFDGSGWGVAALMPEVLAHPRYELVARNPNYLFRKRPG
jgi:hypothetical protein